MFESTARTAGQGPGQGVDPSRRQLIKTGLIGSVVLASSHWLVGCSSQKSPAKLPDELSSLSWVQAGDIAMLAAISRGLLGLESASSDTIYATIRATDNTLAHVQPAAQAEVRQLFDLLQFAPSRIATTGVWRDWSEARPENVRDFLEDWRSSSISLFRSGYKALHDIILGGWYGDQAAWASIGYAGPPALNKYMLTGRNPPVVR